MKNEYFYRFFLICNKLANDTMTGLNFQNFAKLLAEEDEGRYANSQMTKYFTSIEEGLSRLIGNDEGFVWDELEIDEVAELSPEKLQEDFENYCEGKMLLDIRDRHISTDIPLVK